MSGGKKVGAEAGVKVETRQGMKEGKGWVRA